MDVIQSWPPVTRVLTVATLGLSVLIHTGFVDFTHYIFLPDYVFNLKRPEIWRLATAFFITGPKFGIIMDTYFIHSYSSQLERDSPRFTEIGSFFTYLVFVMSTIVAVGGIYFGAFLFLPALILALAYTFSQDNANMPISFYILTFPAKYLPFVLLGMTLILQGPDMALQQLSGLLAAHLYDFLTRIWPTFGGGRNYIQTPDIVKRMFAGPGRPMQHRGYGTAVFPRQDAASGASARTRDMWGSQRGPGRRLGGD